MATVGCLATTLSSFPFYCLTVKEDVIGANITAFGRKLTLF